MASCAYQISAPDFTLPPKEPIPMAKRMNRTEPRIKKETKGVSHNTHYTKKLKKILIVISLFCRDLSPCYSVYDTLSFLFHEPITNNCFALFFIFFYFGSYTAVLKGLTFSFILRVIPGREKVHMENQRLDLAWPSSRQVPSHYPSGPSYRPLSFWNPAI